MKSVTNIFEILKGIKLVFLSFFPPLVTKYKLEISWNPGTFSFLLPIRLTGPKNIQILRWSFLPISVETTAVQFFLPFSFWDRQMNSVNSASKIRPVSKQKQLKIRSLLWLECLWRSKIYFWLSFKRAV